MQRKIDFSIGEYYHIYSRGTDKRTIFLENKDYRRFKILLYLCNNINPVDMCRDFQRNRTFAELFKIKRKETLVDIGIYCLMPNHFHLLIKEKIEGGITKFLVKLLTAYSMYFNKKNGRKGTLFESKFKAKHVDTDNYLKYLFAYIHLNPIKLIDPKWKENGICNRKKAKKYLEEYPFSSYLDYQDVGRLEGRIINREVFPEYFTTKKDFNIFIDEWLSLSKIMQEMQEVGPSRKVRPPAVIHRFHLN
jgi:putative transposase